MTGMSKDFVNVASATQEIKPAVETKKLLHSKRNSYSRDILLNGRKPWLAIHLIEDYYI